MRASSLRLVVALLLVISAGAFVVGVAAERSAEDDDSGHVDEVPAVTTGEPAEEHDEETEAAGAAEAAEPDEGNGEAAETHADEGEAGAESGAHADEGEDILGIDPESTGAVAIAVAISLLLAMAVWLRRTSAVLGAAVVFGLLFAALDVREALHQADESRGGLVALVLLIAVLHVGVAVASGAALRVRSTGTPSPARA